MFTNWDEEYHKFSCHLWIYDIKITLRRVNEEHMTPYDKKIVWYLWACLLNIDKLHEEYCKHDTLFLERKFYYWIYLHHAHLKTINPTT